MADAGMDPGQQLVDATLKCAELSERPISLLQTLQSSVSDVDLDQFVHLLIAVRDVAQQNVALAVQLTEALSPTTPSHPPPPQLPAEVLPREHASSAPATAATPAQIMLAEQGAGGGAAPVVSSSTDVTPADMSPAEALMARALTMVAMAPPAQEDELLQVRILSSPHGKFLQTWPDGQDVFASAFVLDWDLHVWNVRRFTGHQWVALQNVGTGKYLCAECHGDLKADREEVQEWERWELLPVWYPSAIAPVTEPQCFGLRSHHGNFLSVATPGFMRNSTPRLDQSACQVIANRKHCDEWEHLVLVAAYPTPPVSSRVAGA